MIYTLYYTMLARGGRSRAEAHDLAQQEIARTLESGPPDFVRLKRLLTIGSTLGAIVGFAVFVIGLAAWLAFGSLVPLSIAFSIGTVPWALGAIQFLRWLILPVQARSWGEREEPMPWMFRPSWLDIVVGVAVAGAISLAALRSN